MRKACVVLIAPVDSKSWFPTCGAQTPGQCGLDKWYDPDIFKWLLFTGVQLVCNIVSISSIQQSDSVYMYIYSLPGKPVCKYGLPWWLHGWRICLPMQKMQETWVRSLGGEDLLNGNPLQYSCLGNPVDRGAWQATYSPQGRKESDTTEELSPSMIFMQIYFRLFFIIGY